MSSYDQGRMDAWERIDAIKRRLGLAGFFNEQKHKRYPKGHPKAGQFMDLPDNPIKAKVSSVKKSVVDISNRTDTVINGNEFSLKIYGLATTNYASPNRSFDVVFSANGNTQMADGLDSQTKKKAALWWRRQSLDLPKKLPEGTVLSCSVEDGDGQENYRAKFYEAIGFQSGKDGKMFSIVKKGALNPIAEDEVLKAPNRFLVSKGDLNNPDKDVELKKLSASRKMKERLSEADEGLYFAKEAAEKNAKAIKEMQGNPDKLWRLENRKGRLSESQSDIRTYGAKRKALQEKINKNISDKKRLTEKRAKNYD